MKKFLICASALALASCSSAPIRCLAVGENARILNVVPHDGSHADDDYTTFLLTTDNKTVRVCRARNLDVANLKAGQVITGFQYQDDWPYINWYRVA